MSNGKIDLTGPPLPLPDFIFSLSISFLSLNRLRPNRPPHFSIMRRGNIANGISVKVPRCLAVDIPDWVTQVLKRPREKIACLEVTGNSEENYTSILEYCAQRAVDVSEPLPIPPDENGSSASAKKKSGSEREYEGRLSTLYLTKPDDNNSFYTDSEDEFEDLPDSDEENASGNNQSGTEGESSVKPWDTPPGLTFLLGFGCARLEHEGHNLCVTHLVNDAPGQAKGAKPYPSLRIYGDTPERLRSFAEFAIAWDFERKRPEYKPRLGKYVLYTLKCTFIEDEVSGDLRS